MIERITKIVAVVVTTFMLVLFVMAGGPEESSAATPAGEVRVLKLVTPHNPTEFHMKAAYLPMIEEIERESKGKIKIDFYPSETLVKAKATPEAVQQGIVDIGYIVTGYHPAMFPMSDVWSLPMLLGGAVEGWKWDKKLKAKYWDPTYEKSGFVCLGRFLTTPYFVFTARKEIRGLKDLSGLRLKTPGAPGTAFLKALGAQGIVVSTWDVYEALSKGTLDGAIMSLIYIRNAKWHELGKPGYLLMGGPGVSGSSSSLIMSKKVYESFSPDLQKVIDVAGERWGYNISKAYDDLDANALSEFKKTKMVISNFSPEDQEHLKSLAGPVWDNWVAENQSKGYPAKQLLEDLIRWGAGKPK